MMGKKSIPFLLLLFLMTFSLVCGSISTSQSEKYEVSANINKSTLTLGQDIVVTRDNEGTQGEVYLVSVPIDSSTMAGRVYNEEGQINGVALSLKQGILTFPVFLEVGQIEKYKVETDIVGIRVIGSIKKLPDIYYGDNQEECYVFEVSLKNESKYKIANGRYEWGLYNISMAKKGVLKGESLETYEENGIQYIRIGMDQYESTKIYVYEPIEQPSNIAPRETLRKALDGNILAIIGVVGTIIALGIIGLVLYKGGKKTKRTIMAFRDRKS